MVGDARALDVLEAALDHPTQDRDAWLLREHGGEPALVERVRRLLKRETSAAAALPTLPLKPLAEAPPAPPPERVGAYRLTGRLGEGGMGEVFRAERDDGLFEHVAAAKLIGRGRVDRRLEERFAVERRALARLTHPGIARLLDGGVTPEGRAYILMDYVEGAPITEAVVARDLDAPDVVRLVLQVCAAAAAAHRKLVAHGDIKPSNVLVTPEGEVKLLDFGVARLIEAGADDEATPLTVAYASPERVAGEPPSTSDDVYALGVLLRELLSRTGPTLGEVTGRKLPTDLDAVAAKASAARAEDRYSGADALAADLERWLEGRAVEARGRSASYLIRRFVTRRPRAVAAAAAAVFGLLLTAGVTTALYLQAEAARREADRRFDDARGMANYMLTDVFDRLSETPGTIALRGQLANRARRYLEEMTASPRAPAAVRTEAALGYMRLAGVLGFYASGQLGQRDEAQRMLAEAARLLASVPPEARDAPAFLHASGRLEMLRGFAELNRGDGDLGAAGPHLERAEAALAKAAVLTRDADVLNDLWTTRNNLADLAATAGDHKRAEAIARGELTALPERTAALGDNIRTPLLQSESEKLLGNALYYQGDPRAAAEAYRRAMRILEAENARRPGRSVILTELMEAWWALGTTLEELGDRRTAMQLLDRAAETAVQRRAVDPENEQLRRIASMMIVERAGMLARNGRTAEALAASTAETATRRALADARPADLVLQRSWLASLRPIGDIHAAAGDRPRACAAYADALDAWLAYDRVHRLTPHTLATEVALLKREVGACQGLR
jgi:serine/threonine-protein kinase